MKIQDVNRATNSPGGIDSAYIPATDRALPLAAFANGDSERKALATGDSAAGCLTPI